MFNLEYRRIAVVVRFISIENITVLKGDVCQQGQLGTVGKISLELSILEVDVT